MQAVGGHIPLGFLQRADILVHGEVQVTGVVQVVVFHLLRVEVDVSAVVGSRKSHGTTVSRIQHELGRIRHEGARIEGKMVGVELRQAETQFTVSRIAVGRQRGLALEIGIAIHANRRLDGLRGQLRLKDIPSQLQGIGRCDGESRAIGKRLHLELLGDTCHHLRIQHKLVRLELGSLVIELSYAIEAV